MATSFEAHCAPHRTDLQARLQAACGDPCLGVANRYVVPGAAVAAGAAKLSAMLAEQGTGGGKQLRGLLPAAVVAAAGGNVAGAIELGAAIELVHNGTLAHDDVQDNDRLRRGKPTLWTLHGQDQAINAGDALLVGPIGMILRAPTLPADQRAVLAEMLADAVVETVRGQVADIELRDNLAPTLADLVGVHLAKTAPLFGVCLRGAAVVLGKGAAEQQAAVQAATALGLAFQVRDDLLDVAGSKGRGQAGADIREGKITAPILLALNHADAATADDLRQTLRSANRDRLLSDAEVDRWVAFTREAGGAAEAEQWLGTLLQQAGDAARAAFGPAGAEVVLALCERLRLLDG